MSKIVYAADRRPPEARGLIVRALRAFILFGVWVLVGLAGLAAWARLTA